MNVKDVMTLNPIKSSTLKTKLHNSELSVKDAIPKLEVHTISADDSVETALEKMRKNKVGR